MYQFLVIHFTVSLFSFHAQLRNIIRLQSRHWTTNTETILNTGNTSALLLKCFQLKQLELIVYMHFCFSSTFWIWFLHQHMHVFSGLIIRCITTLHKLLTGTQTLSRWPSKMPTFMLFFKICLYEKVLVWVILVQIKLNIFFFYILITSTWSCRQASVQDGSRIHRLNCRETRDISDRFTSYSYQN